jgi:hypothetical protein
MECAHQLKRVYRSPSQSLTKLPSFFVLASI